MKTAIALQSENKFLRDARGNCAEWGVEMQAHHRQIVLIRRHQRSGI
jgi:hypothetical protein